MSYAKDRMAYNKRKREYVSPQLTQRNVLVRTTWFLLFGWWLGLLWMVLILICACGFITWPLIPGLVHQLGPVTTLQRKESIQEREDKLWGIS